MKTKSLTHYLHGSYQVEAIEERLPSGGSIWAARIAAMQRCVAQGPTMEAAVNSLESIFPVYVTARFERGAPIPEPDLPEGTESVLRLIDVIRDGLEEIDASIQVISWNGDNKVQVA